MQQNVVSREYKVMLRRNRFSGNEQELLKTANAVWRDFSNRIADVALDAKGELTKIKTPRLITFFDTSKQHLNTHHYIFRERRDTESGEREVTLKFRHPDRNVAQDRNMKARGDGEHSRTKFEEDIKAPFLSLYSFSTTLKIGDDSTFDTLRDVARLFPDIRNRIDQFEDGRALIAVNDFTAREVVISGARLQVGKTPKVDAESALIVWYDQDGGPEKPVAVEFSYRYGDNDERYEGSTARRAFDVFDLLGRKLGSWVDPKSRTKTAFVLGAQGGGLQ